MNKVMLIGNVGKDPDVRYYDADQAVAQVSLATTERGYTLQNGTQVPDHTDWHNLVFFRGLAKYVEKYVRKGDKLYVEGKIRYRMYDDKQGKRRYVTEIYVDNLEMLVSKASAVAGTSGSSTTGTPLASNSSSATGAPLASNFTSQLASDVNKLSDSTAQNVSTESEENGLPF